jgi:hypothetical protein
LRALGVATDGSLIFGGFGKKISTEKKNAAEQPGDLTVPKRENIPNSVNHPANSMNKPPSPTIRIYSRKRAGVVIGWCAEIKVPGLNIWANVAESSMPTDYWGSIYPTKEAAIEAAKRDIRARS